jgi:hypothetical protein
MARRERGMLCVIRLRYASIFLVCAGAVAIKLG